MKKIICKTFFEVMKILIQFFYPMKIFFKIKILNLTRINIEI